MRKHNLFKISNIKKITYKNIVGVRAQWINIGETVVKKNKVLVSVYSS